VNLQREVVKDTVVQVGYFGKLGRKLLMGLPSNPGIFLPGATLANLDSRRLLQPGFGNNTVLSSEANSSYNSLQVQVQKRFSHHFELAGSYTFSRSLDQASAIAIGGAVPNVFNLHTQWGLSDFYAKHIGTIQGVWELPLLKAAHPAARAVAGGWQVSGSFGFRSGTTVNVVTGADNALSGTPNQRPNVNGNPVLSTDRDKGAKILAWFDRTVFSAPPAGTYGNVGRNALLGPSSAITNFALFKNIPINLREGMRLQFRSEFFNLFNAVNLGNPNASLSAGAQMGRITSADAARVIQFALKFRF
jgi:hypothetical protein